MENINMETVKELDGKLDFLKRVEDSELIQLERDIETYLSNIKVAENYMNRNYKDLRVAMKEKALLEKPSEISFVDEIKHIMEHEMVVNVKVNAEEKKLIIETKNIIILDEEGNKFLGNRYKIVFNYDVYNVRFFGLDENLCRPSYWTRKDPHPHVDGGNGSACLGDAGSMLSISMNEHELYASYIIALNFLQQVNTSDPAGKKISNWDCIDDAGNIIENPYKEQMVECECCGEEISREDSYTCADCGHVVCYDCYRYVANGERVCTDCIDDHYIQCDFCDEYYKDEDIAGSIGGRSICQGCFEEKDYLEACEGCNEIIDTEDGDYVRLPNGDILCDDCAEKYGYTVCDDCGRAFKEGIQEYFDEDCDEYTYLCDGCKTHHTRLRGEEHSEERQDIEPTNPCTRCGKHVEKNEEYIDENGNMICLNCFKELYD